MRGTSITRAMLTAATAALLVAGCGIHRDAGSGGASSAPASSAPADNGIAGLSTDKILERVKTALTEANAFRIRGGIVKNGKLTTIDFKTKGEDLIGSTAVGKEKIDLLAVAGQQYMRPNEAFWASYGDRKLARTITEFVGDRWIKMSKKDDSFSEMFSAAKIDKLFDEMGVVKGTAKDIDGVPAIGLVEGGADGGTLYVATVGEPYPLRMEWTGTDAGGLTFSEFRAAFPEIKRPPAADIVDFDKLKRQA